MRTCASETSPRSIRSSSRPGCRHQDVRACGQPCLLDDPGAAVDGGDRQRPGVSEGPQVSTIWSASSRVGARISAEGRASESLQTLDERHAERERLARSGG